MITGLKSVGKEVEALREMLPRQPTPQDEECSRFMAKLTAKEILKIGDILLRADRGEELTEEEMAFLKAMEDRPAPPLAPLIPGQPVCDHCNKQPASERELAFGTLCDECYDAAGGNFDITTLPRDKYGNYLA